MRPKNVFRAQGIVAPPGVLVPNFYIDPKTKVFGCYARPWEDILVEELEEKMKPPPKKYDWRSVFKQEWQGTFAAADAATTKALYEHKTFNRPSKRYPAPQPGVLIDDMHKVNYADIEMRILATMSDEDKMISGLDFAVIKNRNPEGTCRPTTTSPAPAIFPLSPPPSPSSELKDSVIRRLLAGSVSRSPPSTSG